MLDGTGAWALLRSGHVLAVCSSFKWWHARDSAIQLSADYADQSVRNVDRLFLPATIYTTRYMPTGPLARQSSTQMLLRLVTNSVYPAHSSKQPYCYHHLLYVMCCRHANQPFREAGHHTQMLLSSQHIHHVPASTALDVCSVSVCCLHLLHDMPHSPSVPPPPRRCCSASLLLMCIHHAAARELAI